MKRSTAPPPPSLVTLNNSSRQRYKLVGFVQVSSEPSLSKVQERHCVQPSGSSVLASIVGLSLILFILALTPDTSDAHDYSRQNVAFKSAIMSAVPPVEYIFTSVGQSQTMASGSHMIIVSSRTGFCINISEYPPQGTDCAPGDCSNPPCYCSATVRFKSGLMCGNIANPQPCSQSWFPINCCSSVSNGDTIWIDIDVCATKSWWRRQFHALVEFGAAALAKNRFSWSP